MKNAIINMVIALIIISICTVNTALAEEFSVRNGIHFGMTKDEVEEAEDKLQLSWIGDGYKDAPNGYNYFVGHPSSLAGIAMSDDYIDTIDLQYYFNDDDELNKIVYCFTFHNETKGAFSVSKEAQKQHNELCTALKKKYMKIGGVENGKIDFYPYAGEKSYIFANYMRDYGSFYRVQDWNRFISESDEGGVDIHLWYMSHFSAGKTWIYIEYIYCAPAVYQNILEDYGRVAKEQETDL